MEWMLQVCRTAGLDTPLVVTRAERRDAINALLLREFADVRIVVNPAPEFGQTSSLRTGVAVLPDGCRAFLIYPVDHPLVTAADVVALAEAFEADPKIGVVAPSYAGRRGHPVVVAAAHAGPLLALAPGESARAVLAPAQVPTRFVTVDDDRVLVDMDTPAAYEACKARLAARAGVTAQEPGRDV